MARISALWKTYKRRIIPACLLLAGATMTALGLARGEGAMVLQKAIRVCLECIGIG